MSLEHFRLQLILRNLDRDEEISLEEKVWLVNALLSLPNNMEWSKFVQASIYEGDTDRLLELMHSSNATPLLLNDMAVIAPDHSHPIQLLVKVARTINSFDTKYGMLVLKFCHDDRECEPSLIHYLSRTSYHSQQKLSSNDQQALVPVLQRAQKSVPQTHRMNAEIQRIINTATIKRDLHVVTQSLSDYKINPYIANAERYASGNIEMIDDELRDLFKMSQIFGQANYLCQQPLV
jgi:hypothetical protein